MKTITAACSNDESVPCERPPRASARLALALLRAYKVAISPYFRGSCRFLPSCADYASEAIRRHGLIRGSWLAAARLARCHPLCAGGHDPVPMPSALRRARP